LPHCGLIWASVRSSDAGLYSSEDGGQDLRVTDN